MGALLALVFMADVFVPDPVPYLDEIVLFIMAFTLNVKQKSFFFATLTLLFAALEWFIKLP